MSIEDFEIEKLEFLSRIKLNKDEKSTFIEKFNNVLNLLEIICEFDSDEYQVLTQVLKKKQKFRDDVVYHRNSVEDIFLNSSNKNENYSDKRYFVVPKTI